MNAFAYNSLILIVFLSKRRSRTVDRTRILRRNTGEEARHGIMQTNYEMQLKIALTLAASSVFLGIGHRNQKHVPWTCISIAVPITRNLSSSEIWWAERKRQNLSRNLTRLARSSDKVCFTGLSTDPALYIDDRPGRLEQTPSARLRRRTPIELEGS